jgi:AcrR family transcriptional regulator
MDTRGAILDAGRDLYLEGGLAGLSMRKVAQRVGLSATAIYRHYTDKEDLVLAVCEKGFSRFAQYLSRGLQGETPKERMALSAVAYLDFALEQRGYYEVMFMTPPRQLGMSRLEARAHEEISPSFNYLVDRVRECMEVGDIAPGNPGLTAGIIWSHCHGLVSLWLNGLMAAAFPDQVAFATFYQHAYGRLYAGLGVPG